MKKICRECGKELPTDSQFCQFCGSKNIEIIDESKKTFKRCIDCGKELPLDSDFCMFCGSKSIATKSNTAKIKKAKNSKKINIIKLFLLIIIAIIIMIVYFEMIPHKNDRTILYSNNSNYYSNSTYNLVFSKYEDKDLYVCVKERYKGYKYEIITNEFNSISLPYGIYDIYVAFGNNWIDDLFYFGLDTEFYKGTIVINEVEINSSTIHLISKMPTFKKISYFDFINK